MSNHTQIVIMSPSTLGLDFAQDLNMASYAQNNRLEFRVRHMNKLIFMHLKLNGASKMVALVHSQF